MPDPSNATWTRIAVVSQLALLAYLQIVEWVDLFPWNDVRQGNGQEVLDILLAFVMAAAIFATVKRWGPGVFAALLLYVVWLGLQIWTFWWPYLVGASARWARIHAANFAQTVQWLPSWDNHLPPDANHFVLQLLILWTAIGVGAAFLSLRARRHDSEDD